MATGAQFLVQLLDHVRRTQDSSFSIFLDSLPYEFVGRCRRGSCLCPVHRRVLQEGTDIPRVRSTSSATPIPGAVCGVAQVKMSIP